MSHPPIGITLDLGGSRQLFEVSLVRHSRENYSSAVAAGGGLPIMLPHELDRVDEYLDLISVS